MNKSTVIQLLFVIFGIFSFFRALEYLVGNFALLLWLNDGFSSENFYKSVFSNILIGGFFLLIGYFFIHKSGRLSEWTSQKSFLKGDLEISPSVFEILYSLFVITGVYALTNQLPPIINILYTGFEDKIGRGRLNSIRNSGVDNSWTMVFLKM